MMSPAQQNPTSGAAALDVIEAITANRELARPLVQLLEAAGKDPKTLWKLTQRALTGINDALPVAPSTAAPAVPALDQPLSASTTEQKLHPTDYRQLCEQQRAKNRAMLAKLGYIRRYIRTE